MPLSAHTATIQNRHNGAVRLKTISKSMLQNLAHDCTLDAETLAAGACFFAEFELMVGLPSTSSGTFSDVTARVDGSHPTCDRPVSHIAGGLHLPVLG